MRVSNTDDKLAQLFNLPCMDRLWQWVWDRYGPRYFWALYAAAVPLSLPVYILWSLLVVAVEKSGDYLEAAAVTVVVAAVLQWVALFLGLGEFATSSVRDPGRRGRNGPRADTSAHTRAKGRAACQSRYSR